MVVLDERLGIRRVANLALKVAIVERRAELSLLARELVQHPGFEALQVQLGYAAFALARGHQRVRFREAFHQAYAAGRVGHERVAVWAPGRQRAVEPPAHEKRIAIAALLDIVKTQLAHEELYAAQLDQVAHAQFVSRLRAVAAVEAVDDVLHLVLRAAAAGQQRLQLEVRKLLLGARRRHEQEVVRRVEAETVPIGVPHELAEVLELCSITLLVARLFSELALLREEPRLAVERERVAQDALALVVK